MPPARLRAPRLAAAAAWLLGSAVAAQELRLPAPGSDAWQPLTFPRIERHTRYASAPEDGAVLLAESRCSASARLHPLEDVDLTATPLLRWRWRVDRGLPPGDERSRGGDDFAARVYVTFAWEPGRAGLVERAWRRLAGAVYGETLPGSSLTYVWSSREPAGARWPNPYTDASRMIVATSGAAGSAPSRWVEVEVDLPADYERSFGRAPPAPLFVAVMTDTDDRCLEARARYADFRFAAHARGGR